MDSREKEKYHEIHPVKLAVDIGSAVISIYFFWLQNILIGLIGTLPSIIVSAIIIKWLILRNTSSRLLEGTLTST